jgi:hypothetical protein
MTIEQIKSEGKQHRDDDDEHNISTTTTTTDNDNDNDKPIKSLLTGKGLLPLVGLARLDS